MGFGLTTQWMKESSLLMPWRAERVIMKMVSISGINSMVLKTMVAPMSLGRVMALPLLLVAVVAEGGRRTGGRTVGNDADFSGDCAVGCC